MYEDNVVRSRWPLARVVEIEKGQDDLVRGLQLKTAGGKTFRRPIQKVVLLLEAQCSQGGECDGFTALVVNVGSQL